MSAIEDNISRISKEQWADGYQQGRADFIAEHTQINAYGKPFILISSEEYEQLKEQNNE